MDIMKRHVKPPAGQECKEWIAAYSVEKRHRTRTDSAAARRPPTTLDQIETFAQFRHKIWNFVKVIAIVGIAHDDQASISRGYSSP